LRVAVIGPLAETLYEDWYSGTMPYRVTVADGLRDAVRAAGGDVTCTEGADRVALSALSGLDLGEFDVFGWGSGIVTLRAVANGLFVTVRDDGSLVADQTRPNGWVVHETFRVEAPPGSTGAPGSTAADTTVLLCSTATQRYVAVDERTGALTASAVSPGEAGPLRWRVVRSGIEQARLAASDADVAVVVAGNDPLINGRETQDRTTLALPETQQRLLAAAHAAAPLTVLVVMSSYPYALTWADSNVPAILWTCHGGQEAGRGLADVLLGADAPCGRLPQTWYRRDDDLPGLLDYDIIKARRTYLYFDRAPLYPFGHGLTYTTFAYSGLRLSQDVAGAGDTVDVAAEVTNTGTRDGVEVVQLYTRAVPPAPGLPLRELRDFTRIALRPGETRTVRIPLPVAALARWDVVTHRMTVFPGEYDVLAGSSSEAMGQSARLTVPGTPPAPRRLAGAEVPAADFDDYSGVTLVDATPAEGDAVAPAGEAAGWLLFRDVSFDAADDDNDVAEREWHVTIRVARAQPGTAKIELRRDDPVTGDLLGAVTVPSTGGKYAQQEVMADLAPVPGVFDLYLVLHGAQRVASLRVRPSAAPGS
jgi:beta-glucosidase